MSRQSILVWQSSGMTPVDHAGPRGSPRWDLELARKWRDENRPAATGIGHHGGRRPGAGGKPSRDSDNGETPKTESHTAAQARLASIKADRAALELAREIGKVHDGHECERALAETLGAVSAELESLPRILAMTALRVLKLNPDQQQTLEAAFRDDVERTRDRLSRPDGATVGDVPADSD